MPARRRRTGSENEQNIVVISDNSCWALQNQQNWINNTQTQNDDLNLNDFNNFETSNLDVIMTSRDRTSEFATAIRSMQGRNIARAVAVRDPRKAKVIQSHSEFMHIAKSIGKNIASTYTKLEKLTLLAKKKSLFDDRSAEIQELTYIIKGDLGSLNQQIARLQEISKQQNRNNYGRHLQSHSGSVLLALQSRLASMSTDFKQVLEVRTENLRQQHSRREQFSVGAVSSNFQSSNSVLLSDEVSVEIGEGDHRSIQSGPLVPRQAQQFALRDDTEQYLQNRADTMQNIESTIVELGGIFQQLAHMVKEQEEMVQRIDTNVEDAELNIEMAHSQILKYFQSVTSNRWLMIKIFAVLIMFFIFFVVFLA